MFVNVLQGRGRGRWLCVTEDGLHSLSSSGQASGRPARRRRAARQASGLRQTLTRSARPLPGRAGADRPQPARVPRKGHHQPWPETSSGRARRDSATTPCSAALSDPASRIEGVKTRSMPESRKPFALVCALEREEPQPQRRPSARYYPRPSGPPFVPTFPCIAR